MTTNLPSSIQPVRDALTSPTTYLLRHARGTIVFGTKADLSPHKQFLLDCAPITHILLGDRHHASEHTARLAREVQAPLCASKAEAIAVKPIVADRILLHERQQIVPGLEAIPTPGHTRGAFSYLWTEAGRRYLFVGDTLVPVNGRWEFWVTQKNRALMRESLQTLAALEFDVILSNSFAAVPHAWLEVDHASRAAMFDDLFGRL